MPQCPPAPPSRRSASRSTTRRSMRTRYPLEPPSRRSMSVQRLVAVRRHDALRRHHHGTSRMPAGATFSAQHKSFNDSLLYDATMPSSATLRRSTSGLRTRRSTRMRCPRRHLHGAARVVPLAPPSRCSTSRSTTRRRTTPRCPPAQPSRCSTSRYRTRRSTGRDALGATFTA